MDHFTDEALDVCCSRSQGISTPCNVCGDWLSLSEDHFVVDGEPVHLHCGRPADKANWKRNLEQAESW